MVPLFLVMAAFGMGRVWHAGQWQFAFAPAIVIPLWVMLCLLTPQQGMLVPTIGSNPGAAVMLWFATTALLSMLMLLAIEV